MGALLYTHTYSMPRINNVLLTQIDVQSNVTDFYGIKDKIEAGKNFDGSTVYIGRTDWNEDMCE